MAPRNACLLFLTLSAPAACDPLSNREVGPPVGDRLTAPLSFTVHGELTLETRSGTKPQLVSPLPTGQDFLLRVDPANLRVLLGTPGQAAWHALTTQDGVTFRIAEPVVLPLEQTICGSGAHFPELSFKAGANALMGSATGTAEIIQGDVAFGYTARMDFTGVRDTIGPSLSGASTDQDPLRPVYLTASEPLLSASAAQLFSPSAAAVHLLPRKTDPDSEEVVAFAQPDVALRYSTTYAVQVMYWSDLELNLGQGLDSITTWPAPPLAVEDGFEGGASPVGGAPVVDASVLPPLSGQRSVLVGATGGWSPPINGVKGDRLTVRLAVSTGDRVVRFSLRPVSSFSASVSGYGAEIRLAAPGGSIARVALPQSENLSQQQTMPNGGPQVWLGDARAMEIPLPTGVADEVVFDFGIAVSGGSCGLPIPTASYLVDDLRVE